MDSIERGDAYTGRTPNEHESRSGRPWDDSYADTSPAPWDIGRPQPAIVRLVERDAFQGTVLDAGCGTGEHALYIAARGCETLGVDVAPTAIARAREKAASRRVDATFLVADALQLASLRRAFDRVLDVGLFHTFDDPERRAYVESVASVTNPGGRLYLLCFSDEAPGEGGPRRVTQAELRASFATGWNVLSIAAERIETHLESFPSWLATIERT